MSTTSDTRTSKPRPIIGIIGVVVALSAPMMQLLLGPWLKATFAFPLDRFMSLVIFWLVIVFVLVLSIMIDGVPLATFGIKRGEMPLRARLIELIMAVIGALLVAVTIFGVSGWMRNLLDVPPSPASETLRNFPFWVMFPAWVTAAFGEELLFRSYPIERLSMMGMPRALAGAVTLIAFTLLHLIGWDWLHVLTVVFPAGLLLTLAYLWRRSLLFVMVIHGTINAPLLLLPFIGKYM